MKKILFILISLLYLSSVSAQTTYTLQQCIEYALKNHRSIKIAENDVKIAYERKKEGQAAYLPQINAQIRWDDNLQLQTSALPDEFVSLGFPREIAFGNQYINLVGVQLDQYLYNKSFIDGIRAIKPSYELAELKKIKTEEDVIYNTITGYYQILVITEQEKLLKLNEDRLSRTLPIINLQYEKGVAKKIDVERVQVNLNNIVAQKEILTRNKELTLNNLKYEMGMSLDNSIFIDTNYSKEIIDLNTFSDTLNIKNKIEMKLLRKNLQLQNVLLKRTAAAYFPVLSFNAKYAGQSFGNTFASSFKGWSPIAAIGLRLDIPIFDGLRTASAVRQSKLNIETLKENIAITEDGLKLQMKNSDTRYSTAAKNIEVNLKNMELAKNILDVVTLQYQKGIISFSDFLSAESSYKEAEANYIRSFVDLIKAKLEIDKANGNLSKYK